MCPSEERSDQVNAFHINECRLETQHMHTTYDSEAVCSTTYKNTQDAHQRDFLRFYHKCLTQRQILKHKDHTHKPRAMRPIGSSCVFNVRSYCLDIIARRKTQTHIARIMTRRTNGHVACSSAIECHHCGDMTRDARTPRIGPVACSTSTSECRHTSLSQPTVSIFSREQRGA